MVAVIDFDRDPAARRTSLLDRIPETLHDRVFVVGAKDEAEDLRRSMKQDFTAIGQILNKACLEGDFSPWENEQLEVNKSELERLAKALRDRDFEIGRP